MADIASWMVAVESVCPWPSGSFLAAFDDQRWEADEFVIETSPVGKPGPSIDTEPVACSW